MLTEDSIIIKYPIHLWCPQQLIGTQVNTVFIANTSMIAFSDIEWLFNTNSFITYFSLDSIRRCFLLQRVPELRCMNAILSTALNWCINVYMIYDTKTYTNISQTKCLYIYIYCLHMIQSKFIYKPIAIFASTQMSLIQPEARVLVCRRRVFANRVVRLWVQDTTGSPRVTAEFTPPGALPRTCPSFVGSKFVLVMRHALEQLESSICAKKIASYALQCCIPVKWIVTASRLASGIWVDLVNWFISDENLPMP